MGLPPQGPGEGAPAPPAGFPSLTWPLKLPPELGEFAAPSSMYIGRDDVLEIRSFSNTASSVLTVRARILTPDEGVQIIAFTKPNATTGNPARVRMALREGFLLSVTAQEDTVSARRGFLFVQVLLVRGGAPASDPAALLISDYIERGKIIGWPYSTFLSPLDGQGFLNNTTGADPAAGAEISQTVTAGQRWRLQAFTFTLVTDATVANRNVSIVLDDGADVFYRAGSNFNQVASTTVVYTASGHGQLGSTLNNVVLIPLPQPCMLFQGWRIRTITGAIAAGDNFGAPEINREEWVEG